MQKAAHARIPSRLPRAAPEANCGPCSSSRKKMMGPEFRGRPRSHPATPAPHLRPARLTSAMSMGASVILNKSTVRAFYDDCVWHQSVTLDIQSIINPCVILSGAPAQFISHESHWRGVEGSRGFVLDHAAVGSSLRAYPA